MSDVHASIAKAIRDPIMLFIEREFHMIATVESDELAALLADAVVALVEARDARLARDVEGLLLYGADAATGPGFYVRLADVVALVRGGGAA